MYGIRAILTRKARARIGGKFWQTQIVTGSSASLVGMGRIAAGLGFLFLGPLSPVGLGFHDHYLSTEDWVIFALGIILVTLGGWLQQKEIISTFVASNTNKNNEEK